MLESFDRGFTAIVVGTGGGIGSALTRMLLNESRVDRVIGLGRSRPEMSAEQQSRFRFLELDLEDEASIEAAAHELSDCTPRLIIVASGVLKIDQARPEKHSKAVRGDVFSRMMVINALGPMLVAKHFLSKMPTQGKTVFAALSARVGSISDNRLGGWYSYRASKAALNMLLQTTAIESARTHPERIIAGLHPGTVATSLSAPFVARKSTRTVFSPQQSAEYLLTVVDGLQEGHSGKVLAWDGAVIPA